MVAEPRQVYVSFAWNDDPATRVLVDPTQTLRDAVRHHLPPRLAANQIAILDTQGNDVTNQQGASLENNLRVIVNENGIVQGGGGCQ